MRKFDVPDFYKSSFIATIKSSRKAHDPRKKDFSPSILDFGKVQFLLARHFGFCYGVENAIEIAYKAIEENPDKNIFLLSQMIHNPMVNEDLLSRGVRFIMDTSGNQLIPWNELTKEDIIIVPAFGTTLEIAKKIESIGLTIAKYNTTCPFVEKVWKKSEKLGSTGHAIVIHGKPQHEETRATFSHSDYNGPSLVIEDIKEAKFLGDVILGKQDEDAFVQKFKGRFDGEPATFIQALNKIGVVNQTTMLASETQEIANYLKDIMILKYGEEAYRDHFSDTRDTLCYATNDNQQATFGVLEEEADLAIVVGGYNSSNTSHIVELCEQKLPTFYINAADEIKDKALIHHFDYHRSEKQVTQNYLPSKDVVRIILTSGASCPDTMVDAVLDKILSFFPDSRSKQEVIDALVTSATA